MIEIVSSFPFEFSGTTYSSYLASDKQFYIRLEHICKSLGIDDRSQLYRVKEDEAISDKLADEIFIVNPGGYIGERTKVEIAHALSLGKPVDYLEKIEQTGEETTSIPGMSTSNKAVPGGR